MGALLRSFKIKLFPPCLRDGIYKSGPHIKFWSAPKLETLQTVVSSLKLIQLSLSIIWPRLPLRKADSPKTRVIRMGGVIIPLMRWYIFSSQTPSSVMQPLEELLIRYPAAFLLFQIMYHFVSLFSVLFPKVWDAFPDTLGFLQYSLNPHCFFHIAPCLPCGCMLTEPACLQG